MSQLMYVRPVIYPLSVELLFLAARGLYERVAKLYNRYY